MIQFIPIICSNNSTRHCRTSARFDISFWFVRQQSSALFDSTKHYHLRMKKYSLDFTISEIFSFAYLSQGQNHRELLVASIRTRKRQPTAIEWLGKRKNLSLNTQVQQQNGRQSQVYDRNFKLSRVFVPSWLVQVLPWNDRRYDDVLLSCSTRTRLELFARTVNNARSFPVDSPCP